MLFEKVGKHGTRNKGGSKLIEQTLQSTFLQKKSARIWEIFNNYK